MTFSSLIGNDSARLFLEKAQGQVFLFTGPEGVGKYSFALEFAKMLLGKKHVQKIDSNTHPDLLIFKPEGKTHMHPISSIRKILEEASFPPFEASLKVYIIEEVERMLPSSSNALLKTLEEPHPHLRFILLSSHPEEILPTITSRCTHVPFYPIAESLVTEYLVENKKISVEKAREVALASQGSLGKALQRIEAFEDPIRNIFLDLLKNHFLLPPSLDFLGALGKLEKLLEKKVDAEEESATIQIMDPFLEDLLFWLRDLHLLKSAPGCDLFHSQFKEDLQRQISFKNIPTLERAFHHVEEARLGLQRSCKPKVVLENLFFRLSARI